MSKTERGYPFQYMIHGPSYEKIEHRNDLRSLRKRRRGMSMRNLICADEAGVNDNAKFIHTDNVKW